VEPPNFPGQVWRADQLSSSRAAAVATGFAALDRELPDGGWVCGSLTELLLKQPGIGELRLLQPALRQLPRRRRIALVQPPHRPHVAAWAGWELPPEQLLWLQPRREADALWAAEQILRNGSCGAMVLWQTGLAQSALRTPLLRRLHLAAQASDVLFWLIRPGAAAREASPAPLRLGLQPASGGVRVTFLKRRGPRREEALFLSLAGRSFYGKKGGAPKRIIAVSHRTGLTESRGGKKDASMC
jgi:protein ImuA